MLYSGQLALSVIVCVLDHAIIIVEIKRIDSEEAFVDNVFMQIPPVRDVLDVIAKVAQR